MTAMRVLHISKVTGISGSEGHLLRLLPGLVTRGIVVQMAVLEDPRYPVDAFCQRLQDGAVPVIRVPVRRHLDPGAVRSLARLIRSFAPDVVHTHLVHADFYGLPLAARAGVRCMVSSRHNDDAFRYNPVFRLANRMVMSRVSRVIAISGALGRFVTTVEGIPVERVKVVRYGIDAGEFQPEARHSARVRLGYGAETPLIGFVGRLVRQKGVDVLLEAFAQVERQLPQSRLFIAGDGPLRAELEAQARDLGLGESVRFLGWVSDADRLMPAANVIAVPSRWEGFGLVTLEAMRYAVPLVASRVTALPEIVADGQTGLLVEPDAPEQLAGALQTLLVDSERAGTFGRAGRQRLLDEFSVEKMIAATADVYQEALSRHSGDF